MFGEEVNWAPYQKQKTDLKNMFHGKPSNCQFTAIFLNFSLH